MDLITNIKNPERSNLLKKLLLFLVFTLHGLAVAMEAMQGIIWLFKKGNPWFSQGNIRIYRTEDWCPKFQIVKG